MLRKFGYFLVIAQFIALFTVLFMGAGAQGYMHPFVQAGGRASDLGPHEGGIVGG